MPTFIRLLALSLLLILAFPVGAAEIIGKDDLDAQKELLQLKIDSGRDLVQKDLESLKARIEVLDKRIDDQNNRVGDIGQSVDRFAIIVSIGGLLMTVLLAFGGLIGYFSVAKKAEEEARSASEQWFEDNHKNLTNRILELEIAVERAHQKINNSVNVVEQRGHEIIERMQKDMNAPDEENQPISNSEQEALRQSVERIKAKPENSYSFDDWNTRAFEAHRAGQHEDAALYWKHACSVPNAGAIKTAQALFNRAVTLSQLNRHEESLSTYKDLISTYSADTSPAIRTQVARAMLNLGATLKMAEESDQGIAIYEKLIATYSSDTTPQVREVVAKALLNLGIVLGREKRFDEAIANVQKVIDTYSTDTTPSTRETFAKAIFCRGTIAIQAGKFEEAISPFETVISTYSADTTPIIRESVVNAINGKGFAQLMIGKKTWNEPEQARIFLRNAQSDFLACINQSPDYDIALGNLAYVECLLGNVLGAEAHFRKALRFSKTGNEYLYKATLDDIALHPIPEDTVFREMVDRLWDEYQTEKSVTAAQ